MYCHLLAESTQPVTMATGRVGLLLCLPPSRLLARERLPRSGRGCLHFLRSMLFFRFLRHPCLPYLHALPTPYHWPLGSFSNQPMESTWALPILLVPGSPVQGRTPFLWQLHFSTAAWSEQPLAFQPTIPARRPEVIDPLACRPKHQHYLPEPQGSQHCQCCPLSLTSLLFCRLPAQCCHGPACMTCSRRPSNK